MGAWGQTTWSHTSKEAVIREVEDFCGSENSRSKEVVFHDLRCESFDEAEKTLTGLNASKWGPAIAVSYKRPNPFNKEEFDILWIVDVLVAS